MAAAEVGPRSDLEMRVINRARAEDFAIERLLGSGCDGLVVAARCTREGIPDDRKLYAVKMLFTFNQDDQTRRIRNRYENEWKLLSQRSHPNIIYMWAEFIDVIPDPFYDNIPPDIQDLAVYQHGPRIGTRCRAQFVVFEYHEHDMKRRRPSYSTPLLVGVAKRFASDILEAACFLKRNRIVHLDLKLDNIMVAEDGRLVVIDFGEAKQLPSRDMKIVYIEGMSPGGNLAHLAPEVQQRFSDLSGMEIIPGQQEYIDYSGQMAWAVGTLIFEVITGEHPLVDYPAAYIGHGRTIYEMSDLSPLPVSYPSEFQSIVHRLLHRDVTLRCSVGEARGVIARIPDQSCQTDTMLAHPSRTEIECVSKAVETTTQTLDLLHGRFIQLEGSLRDGFQQERNERSRSIDSVLANLEQIRVDVEQQRGRMVQLDSAVGDITSRFQELRDGNGQVNSDTMRQLRLTVDSLQSQTEPLLRQFMFPKFQEVLKKRKLWDDTWVLERRARGEGPWFVSRTCQDVLTYLQDRHILQLPWLRLVWTCWQLCCGDNDEYCLTVELATVSNDLFIRPRRLQLLNVVLYDPRPSNFGTAVTQFFSYRKSIGTWSRAGYEGFVTVQCGNAPDASSRWETIARSGLSWDERRSFARVDLLLNTEQQAYDTVKFTFTLTKDRHPLKQTERVGMGVTLNLLGDVLIRFD